MMIKLFCACKTASLEEYRARRARRTYYYIGMAVLGVITLIFDELIVPLLVPTNTEAGGFSKGLYLGAGMALIACGIFMAISNHRSLKDEAVLKRCRAEEEDERTHEIARRAIYAAAMVSMSVLYVVMLIAGVFSPVAVLFCVAAILFFFLCMAGFMAYYSRHM